MDQRTAFERRIQAQVDQWNAEIDKLRAKAEVAEADARLQLLQRVEALQHKRDVLGQKLEELRQASEGAWGELKAGVESAFNDLESAFKAAADKVRGH